MSNTDKKGPSRGGFRFKTFPLKRDELPSGKKNRRQRRAERALKPVPIVAPEPGGKVGG